MANAWLRPYLPRDRAKNDVIAQSGEVGAYPAPASSRPDLASTIDQLRTGAQDGQQDTSSVLSGITMAAFTLTDASGAALALESEGR